MSFPSSSTWRNTIFWPPSADLWSRRSDSPEDKKKVRNEFATDPAGARWSRGDQGLNGERRRADSNCRIEVLQTSALPLGYGASRGKKIAIHRPVLKPPPESCRVDAGPGLVLFFWNMRPRIRPVGSQVREAKGERF